MDKQSVLKKIEQVGVVPVVRAESSDNVVRAVEALVAGGIPVAEITMTVPGAVRVIFTTALFLPSASCSTLQSYTRPRSTMFTGISGS